MNNRNKTPGPRARRSTKSSNRRSGVNLNFMPINKIHRIMKSIVGNNTRIARSGAFGLSYLIEMIAKDLLKFGMKSLAKGKNQTFMPIHLIEGIQQYKYAREGLIKAITNPSLRKQFSSLNTQVNTRTNVDDETDDVRPVESEEIEEVPAAKRTTRAKRPASKPRRSASKPRRSANKPRRSASKPRRSASKPRTIMKKNTSRSPIIKKSRNELSDDVKGLDKLYRSPVNRRALSKSLLDKSLSISPKISPAKRESQSRALSRSEAGRSLSRGRALSRNKPSVSRARSLSRNKPSRSASRGRALSRNKPSVSRARSLSRNKPSRSVSRARSLSRNKPSVSRARSLSRNKPSRSASRGRALSKRTSDSGPIIIPTYSTTEAANKAFKKNLEEISSLNSRGRSLTRKTFSGNAADRSASRSRALSKRTADSGPIIVPTYSTTEAANKAFKKNLEEISSLNSRGRSLTRKTFSGNAADRSASRSRSRKAFNKSV